jgi:hypothetical protein
MIETHHIREIEAVRRCRAACRKVRRVHNAAQKQIESLFPRGTRVLFIGQFAGTVEAHVDPVGTGDLLIRFDNAKSPLVAEAIGINSKGCRIVPVDHVCLLADGAPHPESVADLIALGM